jgi:putative DNA primase/helicase
MHRQTTKQLAKNCWTNILTELIGEEAVRKKHGPCPMCGGKDRYRYDNRKGDGDWFCNHCGSGDGFHLLQGSLGIDFAEAARRVDRILKNGVQEEPFQPEIDIEKRRRYLNTLWAAGKSPHVAVEYLNDRGIPGKVISQMTDVRGTLTAWHSDDKCHYPAMLSLIRSPKGKPISIHRTYITADKNDKKITPPIEKISGGYVKLGEPSDTLCLAEGIETALAAWTITGYPAWATISAHGLESFQTIPKHVDRVIVCADNDASFVGQASAFKCAQYFKLRKKITTRVMMPKIEGWDMLDVLNNDGGPLDIEWYGSVGT